MLPPTQVLLHNLECMHEDWMKSIYHVILEGLSAGVQKDDGANQPVAAFMQVRLLSECGARMLPWP